MRGKIAVVGVGLVGGAWAITFARAGHAVALWDAKAGAASDTLKSIAPLLEDLAANDLLMGQTPASVLARIEVAPTLEAAIADAIYIQENATENVAVKRDVFQKLDSLAAPGVIIASSSTAIRPSLFTDHLKGRHRCLVAHPINPPYVIPAVEIVPAPWTDAETVARTAEIMEAIGQKPLVMQREVEGFIMNRLQAAVLQEAFRMVADGIASVEDVDAGIRKGIGLRWAFIGPFETINLNAPGGVVDYASRYGQAMYEIALTQTPPRPWDPELLKKVAAELDRQTPPEKRKERQQWRDKRLIALMAHMTRAERDIGA